MDKLTLYSYAKLNLYLEVLNKRRDNFHNLVTLFERVSLRDTITLRRRRDKLIRISCGASGVPEDKTNLCARSALLLREKYALEYGFDIRINKRIPVGAGLGGGSSNAAAVLLGINRLCRLRLPRKKLAELGGEIGSDVPFFLYQSPFAAASGRGEVIRPLTGLKKTRLWHILVVPRIGVSTPFIYLKWDESCGQRAALTPPPISKNYDDNRLVGGLTRPKYSVNILISTLRKRGFALNPELFFNSLEEVTCRFYPEVKRVKHVLVRLGAKIVLMSGSGPAVFAVTASRKEAIVLRQGLIRAGRPWRVFAVKTL